MQKRQSENTTGATPIGGHVAPQFENPSWVIDVTLHQLKTARVREIKKECGDDPALWGPHLKTDTVLRWLHSCQAEYDGHLIKGAYPGEAGPPSSSSQEPRTVPNQGKFTPPSPGPD